MAPHDGRPHSANAEAADLRLAKEKAVGKAHVLTQPLDIDAFRAQRENEPAVAKPPALLPLGAGAEKFPAAAQPGDDLADHHALAPPGYQPTVNIDAYQNIPRPTTCT